MTRFQRSRSAPNRLRVEGAKKTQRDVAAHAARHLVFVADGGIYGHHTVKGALSRMQQNRCAYCETHVQPAHPGNVDHFRPCGRVKQADGQPAQTPGYFWLAYAWENLLLACTTCNTSRKRDLFPLRQPRLRARTAGEDDEGAGPLLIDPAREEPRDHLRYRGAVAYAVGGSERGLAMCEVFHLNKNRVLLESRREHLASFAAIAQTAEDHPKLEVRGQAEALLRRMLGGGTQYYAMVCDAFRALVAEGRVVRLAGLCPAG